MGSVSGHLEHSDSLRRLLSASLLKYVEKVKVNKVVTIEKVRKAVVWLEGGQAVGVCNMCRAAQTRR